MRLKAREATFKELIEGEKQFQVPLFQRTYTWEETNLKRLWEDVLNQTEELANGDPGPTHFLGSIVLAPSPLMQVYSAHWLPMQKELGENLELLIYLDLILHGEERAKQSDLYSAEQRRLTPASGNEALLQAEVVNLQGAGVSSSCSSTRAPNLTGRSARGCDASTSGRRRPPTRCCCTCWSCGSRARRPLRRSRRRSSTSRASWSGG